MTRLAPVLTPLDHERISRSVGSARSSWRSFRPYVQALHRTLVSAEIVPAPEVSHDVITMNTTFEVQHVRTGETARHTLVYEDVPRNPGDISILTPAGNALLSARVGDIVSWADGELVQTVSIRSILYQPEAAGDFDR
jgi:regulator of nucleoside diphosphate kinase